MSDDRSDRSNRSRRRFLQAAAGSAPIVGLAGCLGREENYRNVDHEEMRTVPPSEEADNQYDVGPLGEPVPEAERECVSVDGIQRDPDDLESKEDVAYQTSPSGFQLCANCEYFCPSETDERTGACTEVEGRIGSRHWCALWAPADWVEEDGSDPNEH